MSLGKRVRPDENTPSRPPLTPAPSRSHSFDAFGTPITNLPLLTPSTPGGFEFVDALIHFSSEGEKISGAMYSGYFRDYKTLWER